MLFSFSFAQEWFACKSKNYLYTISDAGSNRLNVAMDFLLEKKCKILYSGNIVYKGKYFYKIRYGEDIWYMINPNLR